MRISDWSSDVCSSDLREEVIQYVYNKYGRTRAALAATVIRYRGKSAVRDVAKAFGLPPDQVTLLAECYGWGNGETPMEQRLGEAGFHMENPLVASVLAGTDMLPARPLHLSPPVGGCVAPDQPLWETVTVETEGSTVPTDIPGTRAAPQSPGRPTV